MQETMEGIEISESKIGARGDIALLTIRGYVDTMTCAGLLNKITGHLNDGILHVIVDMAQVNYVSSAGWGVFVGEIKGIREQGGDLKLVQMTPEVYDVFEMLEFHRILAYYESIEEAINDFDFSIGVDITKSIKKSVGTADTNVGAVVQRTVPRQGDAAGSGYIFKKKEVNYALLPLSEKIKGVVTEDPLRDIFKIRKSLNSPKYGNAKVGLFGLYRLLKRLNLENKEKRYRFYRSR
jgi:anti-sigma B factor antagonist